MAFENFYFLCFSLKEERCSRRREFWRSSSCESVFLQT